MADDKKLDYIQERVDTVVDRVADLSKSIEALKTSFEHHVGQDEKMYEELVRLNDTLDHNTASLKEHMRRTDLLEDYVKGVDARFSPLEMELLRKKAVGSWISQHMKFIAKLAAAVSGAGVLAVALKKLLELLLAS
jgi:DNA-directed RNA polymerase sigma subunit (sigma70/sigma32)